MIQTIHGQLSGKSAPAVSGTVQIPASKSHTIRALLIAAFSKGESRLQHPLISGDSLSCRAAVENLGATVTEKNGDWLVHSIPPHSDGSEERKINVGNSGTTLYLACALAALSGQTIHFDGDSQIRRRSAEPLLLALEQLGAVVQSTNYCAPFSVRGPLKPGTVTLDCPVSQYLSALLLATPLISSPNSEETLICVKSLNEAPYVEMTLNWMYNQGIHYKRDGWNWFRITGNQSYKPFNGSIPGDWSSAAFFLTAAAITEGTLFAEGLDTEDSQGDKAIVTMLEDMGCVVRKTPRGIHIEGRPLKGVRIDMNATPDALPAMAVAGCFAQGETLLLNVPQARTKETDRISVMTSELRKMGALVEELPDGMKIQGNPFGLRGTTVNSHGDHRVAMALSIAALRCNGKTHVQNADATAITFPEFFTLLKHCTNEQILS